MHKRTFLKFSALAAATVLSLPLMASIAILTRPASWNGISLPAWLGLGYVAVFSMLLGFVFWYRGLARGGIANIGQLQLLQPFFGLALAGLLLHEPIAGSMIAATGFVIACVALARKFG